MKGARINLLLRRQNNQAIEDFFRRFRFFTFLYSLTIVISMIVLYIYNAGIVYNINLLNEQKKNYLIELKENSTQEANFNYISKKLGLFDKYIADDPKLISYYIVLANSVKQGTESAQLTSFSLTSDRRVIFRVSFKNQSEMITFLRTIESPDFLKNFQSLSLVKVSNLVQNREIAKEASTYELSFEGVFKNLNANKN